MAESLAIIGGVGSIIQIISSVTRLAKSLNEVRESYDNVALNTTLVASQLSTIRAALEALHQWRLSDNVETEASIQLDKDLGLSLSCCAILITVIDGKLAESGYKPGIGIKQKVKYIWLEDILKEYVSNLEGQVRALQLLLTIFQCRTATEQKQQLAKAESRSIIDQVRAETMTLGFGEMEIDDTISILSHASHDPLDVESILMKSPAYVRVYGGNKSPRRRKTEPPPPPPPRRKSAPLSQLPPPERKAPASPSMPNSQPGLQLPSLPVPHLAPPPEIAPQPPPVPPRPKARSQPRQPRKEVYDRDQTRSQGRINVWDFLGPDEAHDTDVVVMADSAPVFELPASSAATRLPTKPEEAAPHAMNFSSSWIAPRNADTDALTQPEPEPSAATSKSLVSIYEDPTSLSKKRESVDATSMPIASLEGFRIQLDVAFEDRRPSFSKEQGLRLSLGPIEKDDTHSAPHEGEAKAVDNVQIEPPFREEEVVAADETSSAKNDVHREESELVDTAHETLSITSSVNLYDASARNMPIGEADRPTSSHSPTEQKTTNAGDATSEHDELKTQTGDIAFFNERLASKTSGSLTAQDSQSATIDRDIPTNSKEINPAQPGLQGLGLSPTIVMTPSDDPSEADASPQFSPYAKNEVSAPPSRVPPLSTIRTAPIPPVPYTSPLPFTPVTSMSGMETSTSSSGRDSSVFEASSTISSSEPSVDNTTLTVPQSTLNTLATSVGTDGPASAREQAQADLRRLQSELTAAKARGDSNAAQESLQRSIEVIRRTYLAPTVTAETKKLPKRASFRRFSSLQDWGKGSALGDAAAAGDIAAVSALLDGAININARGDKHWTPMMRAATNGHLECLDILIKHGADAFAVDPKGRTVLHLAVAANRLTVVKRLLDAYPPPQIRQRASILSKATESLMSRSAKNLRETSDAEGSKVLHIAVESDRGGVMKALLAAGVDIESKNNWGRTPLHQAIIADRRDSFEILLRSGASVNAVDAVSMSSLHWAARRGHSDMIKILLASRADRCQYDRNGYLPLHQAAYGGHILCIEGLLRKEEDLEIRTKAGESLLHIAGVTDNVELATYLSKHGPEVNPWAAPQTTLLETLSDFKVPLTSLTPLHYACCRGNYELVLLLLDNGAWVNAPTPEGVTALMMATESENTNTVNLLLTRGAKVNASMPGTLTTALHIACRRGDLETVQQLSRSNANQLARLSSSTYPGRTPAEEVTAKCTDPRKRHAIEEYFRVIRENRLRGVPRSSLGSSLDVRPSYEMVGHANMTRPTSAIRPMQPVSYAPWGQHNGGPMQAMQYGFQQPHPATYPQWTPQPQGQSPQQWYDPNPLTHVESPPPYQPGSFVPPRLAAQAPVHRPGE